MNEEIKEPIFTYPESLPICAYRQEILTSLKENNIIIVCGETGSGKTTQLPKMAMELALGSNGRKIACTQPRRVAATTVAERVAKEIGSEIGQIIGYQHRFDKKVSENTRVKFMTDGILLAETLHDPLLKAYDTIIIDEAHERTLNIDFLLGIVKRISQKRRDIKIIISSATLDTERFSKFFDGAKTIIVPGRLYPVTTLYRPCEDEEMRDLPRDVAKAARELPPDDDILVFLPGERDIRETADYLSRDIFLRQSEIIPLYAALPPGEIKRAFKTLPKRRIVLATNVAETSLTIPGIKAVIDSGLARLSRYIHRTHVQRLQIEPISRASARQRAGRCGRIAPGTCIRLYSEEDFNSRDEYTPPEILRSSLAGVILTMLELRLGAIESFPFIDPPKPTMIREGLRELIELGAIGRNNRNDEIRLSKIGRRLAHFPLEPRLARMLLAASDFGTLPRVLPVVAAMGCDNPKKRPIDEKDAADRAHAKWRVKGSDFLGTLSLWNWWSEKSESLSATKMRKLAEENYLSYPKMREWRELVFRLKELCRSLKLDITSNNIDDAYFHRSLLPSLLGRIGKFDEENKDYKAAHGIRFAIHPSSSLAKKQKPQQAKFNGASKEKINSQKQQACQWVMAGELVDTSRLFARDVAEIDVSWIESAAQNLCKRSYYDPQWDKQSGFARAKERVTLYGLVIVDGRRRDLSRIDPPLARKLMIFHGLVNGEFSNPPQIVRENNSLIAELRELAEQRRVKDLFDIDKFVQKFSSVIPQSVACARDLKVWLHTATKAELKAFKLVRSEWIGNISNNSGDYPESITIAGCKFKLEYRHCPENPQLDGITCIALKSTAKTLTLWNADWLVPGLLPEKVAAILNSLPSSLRRALPPTQEIIPIVMPLLKPSTETLLEAIRKTIISRFAVRIPSKTLSDIKIPDHLKVRFVIRDDNTHKIIASSRNLLEALNLAGIAKNEPSSTSNSLSNFTTWDFPNLEEISESKSGNLEVRLFKGLYDEGDGVSIKLFKTAAAANIAHNNGVARLIALDLTRFTKKDYPVKSLSIRGALYFKNSNYPLNRISNDVLIKAIKIAAVNGKEKILTQEQFLQRIKDSKAEINRVYTELTHLSAEIFDAAAECSNTITNADLPSDICDDITTQLAWLIYPGFINSVDYTKLKQYPRFLKALMMRIGRAKLDKTRDRSKMERFAPYWEQYRQTATGNGKRITNANAFMQYRWLLEEFRISIFAQELKTIERVSPEILSRLWLEATEEI